jgi:hypothetical protein
MRPIMLMCRGVACYFTGYAPITKDALYQGIHPKTEQRIMLLVPNPDAVYFQRRFFQNNPV